jgi:hypothetical protein
MQVYYGFRHFPNTQLLMRFRTRKWVTLLYYHRVALEKKQIFASPVLDLQSALILVL